MLLSEGQMSDHKGARFLLEGLPPASTLIADRGYDSNWFRDALETRGVSPCIPPTRNRKAPLDYDASPLGIKETTKWLNALGHRTRRGSTFGVGPVHVILTNRCYATGKWPYGVRNSRTGLRHDPATIVEIDVPTIVPLDAFEYVQSRLAAKNPKTTPPRVVNGQTILTGLAVCAACGAGMTRTRTRRRDRSYSYYSCAGCLKKGGTVCRGRHMPMRKLDELVIANVKERLFTPDRLAAILEALVERQSVKDLAVQDPRAAIMCELSAKQEKLTRLYPAIEEGVVDLDDELAGRIKALKAERDIAQASLDRISCKQTAASALTPERLETFASLVREKIDSADTQARKAYLRSVISYVGVDDDSVRIVGDKATLAAVIAGSATRPDNVRGFVSKWRARTGSNRQPSVSKTDTLSG
jgi:site-specific DNA recombinase